MTFNRNLWLHSFGQNNFPNWTCPRCEIGVLRPIEKTFSYEASGDITSEIIKYGEYFEYDSYTFRYSVLLKCNNYNCQECVASCGHGYVQTEHVSGTQEGKFFNVFDPKYFYPALAIFKIPKECPVEITEKIKTSFQLFFSDAPAAANHVRKTIESILTDRGIKRFSSVKGKRKSINLHGRIVEFEKKDPENAKKLFAIKWLGNEGSHTDTITKNDVLDAYEILEFVLDDLYIGYRKSVDKKVS